MDVTAIYSALMEGGGGTLLDPFDAHVLASVLALAIAETKTGGLPLSQGTGLTAATLNTLLSKIFPHAPPLLEGDGDGPEVSIPEDERCLRELLMRSTTHRTPFQLCLAALISRRAMLPNHLWQDLGLRNRGELSELMHRHFRPLASRNVNDMKWKKFLYRMICRDEGFRPCTAPSCAECDDFSACFGDESGESLLARNRRQAGISSLAGAPD
jgi:nitrogen fixation protein NifQ